MNGMCKVTEDWKGGCLFLTGDTGSIQLDRLDLLDLCW